MRSRLLKATARILQLFLAAGILMCTAQLTMAASKTKDEASDRPDGDDEIQRVEYPPYGGPKQVVAVLPFENKVEGIEGATGLGNGLSDILVTELVRSNRFLVVEREAIKEIIQEQTLGMSGLVNQQTSIPTGQMAGAQFFVKGAVTEFNDKAGGGGLTLKYATGEVGGKSRTAYVGIDVRIIDNATGQVYASYNANAKARGGAFRLGTSFLHDSENFKLGANAFFQTALGKATRKAIQKIMGFILEESVAIPWQGSVIKADSKVYINRGVSAGVKEGDEFRVFSKGEPLIDPETGFNLGTDEEFLCAVLVTKAAPKFAIARKKPDCEGLSISRGDLVRF